MVPCGGWGCAELPAGPRATRGLSPGAANWFANPADLFDEPQPGEELVGRFAATGRPEPAVE